MKSLSDFVLISDWLFFYSDDSFISARQIHFIKKSNSFSFKKKKSYIFFQTERRPYKKIQFNFFFVIISHSVLCMKKNVYTKFRKKGKAFTAIHHISFSLTKFPYIYINVYCIYVHDWTKMCKHTYVYISVLCSRYYI